MDDIQLQPTPSEQVTALSNINQRARSQTRVYDDIRRFERDIKWAEDECSFGHACLIITEELLIESNRNVRETHENSRRRDKVMERHQKLLTDCAFEKDRYERQQALIKEWKALHEECKTAYQKGRPDRHNTQELMREQLEQCACAGLAYFRERQCSCGYHFGAS
ncbi:MAG: hypothetical protein M1828_006582 [Chrysothrix sp. TS-e1954]|nr:MAG: hypothetical protein M1828_006582 [Chrysothrix sp. TS-e1954]